MAQASSVKSLSSVRGQQCERNVVMLKDGLVGHKIGVVRVQLAAWLDAVVLLEESRGRSFGVQ
eukprot:10859895-Prorocentrum_lima.AAC.1